MEITLARGLKLKNRLVGKLGTVSGKISRYNSIETKAEVVEDVKALMKTREKIVDSIIELKSGINCANAPIQKNIYLLAELKNDLAFLGGLCTTHGESSSGSWGGTDRITENVAIFRYADVELLKEGAERDIDANQDILDKHNHNTLINVSQEVLDIV
jgi:hypothetical protein